MASAVAHEKTILQTYHNTDFYLSNPKNRQAVKSSLSYPKEPLTRKQLFTCILSEDSEQENPPEQQELDLASRK